MSQQGARNKSNVSITQGADKIAATAAGHFLLFVLSQQREASRENDSELLDNWKDAHSKPKPQIDDRNSCTEVFSAQIPVKPQNPLWDY